MSDVDATPGSPDANSYATVEEADAYFEDRTVHAGWGAADADTKRRALIEGTRQLDAHMEWQGFPASRTQALGFPRYGLLEPDTGAPVDPTTIPPRVVWSTAEQAAALVTGDRTAELAQDVQGIKSLRAGSVEITFKEGGGTRSHATSVVVPPAFNYVACWGRLTTIGGAGGGIGGTVSLVRT